MATRVMTSDEFARHLRDGEALGISRAETYQAIKNGGWSIEGEPEDRLTPQKSGGVFNYFADTIRNAAREVGAVAKFGGEVIANPMKGLEFGKDVLAGGARLAVGAGETAYEALTGNVAPEFNPDGTITYPENTQNQEVFLGAVDSVKKAVSNPLETFKNNPLATLSTVAPIGAGVLGKASSLAKSAGYAKTGKALGTAGSVVGALDPVAGTAKLAAAAPKAVANYGAGMLGAVTGAGDDAVRLAAAPRVQGDAFFQGMRGDPLEQARILADDAKKALGIMREQRAKQYLKTKEAIDGISKAISPRSLQTVLNKHLDDFGIASTEKDLLGRMVGMSDDQAANLLNEMLAKDTSTLSPLVKAGLGEGPTASKISKAIAYVERWDDLTPSGLDKLQKNLSTIQAKPGTQEFAFISRLKKDVQNLVKDKYPEYSKLLDDYSQASELIDEMEQAIGSRNAQSVEKTVLKLSQSMNSGNLRFEIKNALVKQLEDITGLPLRDRVSGMMLSNQYPRGLAKVGVGLGTLVGTLGAMSNVIAPQYLFGLALSSPRVVGEVLGHLGVAKKYIPTVSLRLREVLPVLNTIRSSVAVDQLSDQQ